MTATKRGRTSAKIIRSKASKAAASASRGTGIYRVRFRSRSDRLKGQRILFDVGEFLALPKDTFMITLEQREALKNKEIDFETLRK